jgi:malonyl-CoA/methylmalonyl-CoA synthetase
MMGRVETTWPSWAPHLSAAHPFAPAQLTAAGSLPARWVANWRAAPLDPVLFDGGRWWDGAQLEEATALVAGRLQGAGLDVGDRVLVSASPSAALVVAHVACLRAGLTVVPANTGYQQPELAPVVQDARPALAIVDDDTRASWLRSADPALRVVGVDVALPPAPATDLDTATAETPALIGYTSGTTGRPKGAVLTHGNLLASVEALLLAWRWTADDRLVLALPLFHMHGLGVGLHGTLAAGASAVLVPRFSPDAVLDAAATHRASLLFGVPTMYSRLVESARVAELRSLRLCVSGSAPLPAELHRAFREASGQTVLERYGMTETAMLVSNPYDGERRPGTVGFPLPGVALRLSEGRAEILVRGPNVFGGYLDRPEATAEAFDGEGYFRTGDLGALDPDGYLRIVGRAKELIISGGYNVYPREVEDALRTHPGVGDAAVVGRPDPEWGEAVTAFVETDGTVSSDELRRHVAGQLAAYKRPKTVVVLKELPRNALGKVQKHLL